MPSLDGLMLRINELERSGQVMTAMAVLSGALNKWCLPSIHALQTGYSWKGGKEHLSYSLRFNPCRITGSTPFEFACMQEMLTA